MGRSSRFALLLSSTVLASTGAWAQMYGVPGAVGGGDGFAGQPAFAPPPADYAAPPPLPPRPTLCPLIIKVGRGLAHSVRTRVVYGHPACL